jgi:shikimate dehydrogenase
MQLSGQTGVVGIFGDPVAHSLSPRMQNAAIKAGGLNAVYVPFHVTPDQLCDAVSGLRAMSLRGINSNAETIGAINTIVNEDGRLKGYNTDGVGLLKALKLELDLDVAGKRVLFLGAGGACRAALVAACHAKAAWVGIANRTRQRSQKIIEELAPHFSGTAFAEYELAPGLSEACQEPVDLLVNTTAVGLKGETFGFSTSTCVKASGAVFDMVYASEPTALLVEARERGLLVADGLGMLAAQGEAAFELWFGCAPETGVMRQALDVVV